MIGVPSITSRLRTVTFDVDGRDLNAVKTKGLGRSADLVLKTPVAGGRLSSRGCTLSTSRRERSSHLNTKMLSPAWRPSSPSTTRRRTRAPRPAPSHRPVSVRQRDRREASEPTRSDARGTPRPALQHLGCPSSRQAPSVPSGVFVTVVEIGHMGMGVHEHLVPMSVLMPSDSLLDVKRGRGDRHRGHVRGRAPSRRDGARGGALTPSPQRHPPRPGPRQHLGRASPAHRARSTPPPAPTNGATAKISCARAAPRSRAPATHSVIDSP